MIISPHKENIYSINDFTVAILCKEHRRDVFSFDKNNTLTRINNEDIRNRIMNNDISYFCYVLESHTNRRFKIDYS